MSIRILYDRIKAVKLEDKISTIKFFHDNHNDARIQGLKTLLQTELNYLLKIQDLLVSVHDTFEKFSFRPVINKNQFVSLYQSFPKIFNLHLDFRENLINEMNNRQMVGNIFISFLTNHDVLEVYLNYITHIADYLNLCQQIRLNESSNRNCQLYLLESVIMMPIQKFPQLQLIILDIYKNTDDEHDDKRNLYKTNCLLKCISMCLDERLKFQESTDINEISILMRKLKKLVKSEKVISKYFIFHLKSDFGIPRKLVKLPYNLVLCNKEIIMYPKDIQMTEITSEMVYHYSLEDLNLQIKNIFGFSNQKSSREEFLKTKEFFPLIKDAVINNNVIMEVEEILNDYHIIMKILEDVEHLNFRYNSLEPVKISRSLLSLENSLCEKERELNNYFDSILNLKIKRKDSVEDTIIILFDSSRQANDWKTQFYRTKHLLNLNISSDWIPIVIGNEGILKNITFDFPLFFPPYILCNNGIVNIRCSVTKSQAITIDIGTKVSRCVWLSMSDGSVIILHFNYKEWSVLENFQTKFSKSISASCSFAVFDSRIADVSLDSEMWMSCDNQLISHSLRDNLRSVEVSCFSYPSNINTICQVENKMFVGLKSLNIYVYAQKSISMWLHEYIISLEKCVDSKDEELKNIVYSGDSLVYFVFHKLVAIYDISKMSNNPINIFSVTSKISCFHTTSEGVWIANYNDLNLILYDKTLTFLLQTLSFPESFFGKYTFSSITSILFTKTNLWIGTEGGFIALISIIDRLSCMETKVTIYLSSKFTKSPVIHLLQFQNIHGVHCKTKFQNMDRNCSETRIAKVKRSFSSPPKIEKHFSSLSNKRLDKDNCDTLDHESKSRSENFKNNLPTLVIAIGVGLFQFSNFKQYDDLHPITIQKQHIEQCLFTFLE